MKDKRFVSWFSDVGFTCRVLIISEMLMEWATTWDADVNSPFVQAVREVEETALLEMERYESIGKLHLYFKPEVAAGFGQGPAGSENRAPD